MESLTNSLQVSPNRPVVALVALGVSCCLVIAFESRVRVRTTTRKPRGRWLPRLISFLGFSLAVSSPAAAHEKRAHTPNRATSAAAPPWSGSGGSPPPHSLDPAVAAPDQRNVDTRASHPAIHGTRRGRLHPLFPRVTRDEQRARMHAMRLHPAGKGLIPPMAPVEEVTFDELDSDDLEPISPDDTKTVTFHDVAKGSHLNRRRRPATVPYHSIGRTDHQRARPVAESVRAIHHEPGASRNSTARPATNGRSPGPHSRSMGHMDSEGQVLRGNALHIVKEGESLWSIAARYLDTDDIREIARFWPLIHRANRDTLGSDPNLIQPGQELILPPNPLVSPRTDDASQA
jgi:hypothetical protein